MHLNNLGLHELGLAETLLYQYFEWSEIIMEKVETKICKICGTEKELSEFYSQIRTMKDGSTRVSYHPKCKECDKKAQRQRILENHEEYLAYLKKYNKEYFSTPEGREVHRKHSQTFRDRGQFRKWQQENKDKIIGYNLKRKMNKKHEISKKEWDSCKEYFNNSCAYCGMSEKAAKEKYNQQLHKEHVEHTGANDISNCVPACKSCNGSKNTMELNEWYNENNPNFTYERLEKIHKWLNKDYKEYIKIK